MVSTNADSVAPSRKARVIIVDDHLALRQGLALLLAGTPGLELCGEASTGNDAVDLVRRLKPDLLLLDLNLPDGSGIAVIRRVRTVHPELRILVCSMHDRRLFEAHVLRAGGHGYVSKGQGWSDIEAAIRRVLDGHVAFSADVVTALAATGGGSDGTATRPATRPLTDRENAVLDLYGEGFGPTAIAARLNLSVKTVETHFASARRKLHVESAAEMRRYAIQARWSGPVPPP